MPRGPYTEEQKRVASERMRLVWAKKKADRQGYQEAPIVGVSPHSTQQQIEQEQILEQQLNTSSVVVMDTDGGRVIITQDEWQTLPFPDALAKLMKMEKELVHARSVLSLRSASLPKVWTCWTALNRKAHSNLPGMTSTYAKCFKNIPDGKWVFKDDCNINKETGMVDPVVCCSNDCFMLYQIYKSRTRAKERESLESENP